MPILLAADRAMQGSCEIQQAPLRATQDKQQLIIRLQ